MLTPPDQLVIAGERPDLDLGLVPPLTTPFSVAFKLGLIRRIDHRQPTREQSAVPGRDLTGVADDGGHR